MLINEFGEVGLDHLLLGRLDADPVLLESGCICCSIRGDLQPRHARPPGSPPVLATSRRFDRVIVETTGLADPVPILATIASDLVLRRHFRLGNVIATVDAVHAERGLESYGEMLKQVAVADRLLLTKTDLAPATQVDRLLGTAAPDQSGGCCRSSGERPGGSGLRPADKTFAILRQGWQRFRLDTDAKTAPGPTTGHAGGVRSFVLTHDRPLDWSAFGLWFSLLVHRHGDRLLRVKGMLDIEGSTTPVAVHAVQHLMHAPEHLPPGQPLRDLAPRIHHRRAGQ